MVNDNSKVYYCTQCKKLINEIEDLFFVDDSNSKGFCSEVCIEKFYNHLIMHYEKILEKLREKYNLEDEILKEKILEPKHLQSLLLDPDEIFKIDNEVNEDIYVFLKYMNEDDIDYFLVVYAFVFEFRPSFILLSTSTGSVELLEKLKIGENIDDISKFIESSKNNPAEVLQIDNNLLESLENKKSKILADLINLKKENDINIEDYLMYEEFYQETLKNPDEIFHFVDEDGDNIFTYIRAHEKNSKSFYYIIQCLQYDQIQDGHDIRKLYPVLSFPTEDQDLYKSCKQGNQLSGNLKN